MNVGCHGLGYEWIHKHKQCVCGWIWMESLRNVYNFTCPRIHCNHHRRRLRRNSRLFHTWHIAGLWEFASHSSHFLELLWLLLSDKVSRQCPEPMMMMLQIENVAGNYQQPSSKLIGLLALIWAPEWKRKQKCHINWEHSVKYQSNCKRSIIKQS